MQGWYDKNIKACHVTLWDLGETEDNHSDDEAEGVTLSLQVKFNFRSLIRIDDILRSVI